MGKIKILNNGICTKSSRTCTKSSRNLHEVKSDLHEVKSESDKKGVQLVEQYEYKMNDYEGEKVFFFLRFLGLGSGSFSVRFCSSF